MRQYFLLFIAVFVFCSTFTSCDDGMVHEHYNNTIDGRVVRAVGNISGKETWADGYSLAIAGFTDNSEYAVIMKKIVEPTSDGPIDVTLAGIPDSVSSIELCAVNSLRIRVATFATLSTDDIKTSLDTIPFAVGSQDVSMLNAIQDNLFSTTCANCHGSSNSAAAGLFLTKGKSYENLVNIQSKKNPELLRVKPGDTENSMLSQALFSNISRDWHYDHSHEVLENNKMKNVLNDWINSGARN